MCLVIRLNCVVLVISEILSSFIAAEETQLSGFQDVITRMAVARSALVAFDVEISGTIRRKAVTADRSVGSFDLRIAFEEPEGRLFVARRNVYVRNGKETTDRDQRSWSVFVDTPEWELFRTGANDGGIWERGRHRGPKPEFFDPRGLGLSFCAGLRYGAPAAQVFGDYGQWSDTFVKTNLGGGKIRFDDTQQDYRVVVDIERGYWPVEMIRLNTRGETQVMTLIELVQIDGTWLPTTAKIICSDEEWNTSFRWKSINRPLPATLFDEKNIASTYAFAIVEQRDRPNHGRKLAAK